MKNNPLIVTCLGMDKWSLRWQCELNPFDTIDFLNSCQEYNGMNNLSGMVEKINLLIPRMEFGKGNPNNNKSFHTFRVGNENSRVIYLDFSKAYLTKYRENKWNENDILSLIFEIQLLARKAGADEISIDNNEYSVTIRMWWD